MASAEQWFSNLSKKLKQRQEREDQDAKLYVVKEDRLKAHAPRLWEELLSAFSSCRDVYNKLKNADDPMLVFNQPGVHIFILRIDGRLPEVRGQYDYETRQIHVMGDIPGINDVYEPRVSLQEGGQVLLFNRSNGQPKTPSEVAQSVLDRFLMQR
jgi:hypothetical protein